MSPVSAPCLCRHAGCGSACHDLHLSAAWSQGHSSVCLCLKGLETSSIAVSSASQAGHGTRLPWGWQQGTGSAVREALWPCERGDNAFQQRLRPERLALCPHMPASMAASSRWKAKTHHWIGRYHLALCDTTADEARHGLSRRCSHQERLKPAAANCSKISEDSSRGAAQGHGQAQAASCPKP